jgi:hypothetical protein
MTPSIRPVASRAKAWWFGLMASGGFVFGLSGDRRPFGADVLAHPLVVFFALVAAALVALRLARGRPVPELIPERALVIGCVVGAAGFLVGNWVAAHVIAGVVARM